MVASYNFFNLWLAEVNVDVIIGPVLDVFSDVEEDVGCCKVWIMFKLR